MNIFAGILHYLVMALRIECSLCKWSCIAVVYKCIKCKVFFILQKWQLHGVENWEEVNLSRNLISRCLPILKYGFLFFNMSLSLWFQVFYCAWYLRLVSSVLLRLRIKVTLRTVLYCYWLHNGHMWWVLSSLSNQMATVSTVPRLDTQLLLHNWYLPSHRDCTCLFIVDTIVSNNLSI